jgi:hypothetical protein
MTLAEIILFLLWTTGATFIVVSSTILEPVRQFIFSKIPLSEKLLTCHMCTGFWIGVFAGLAHVELNALQAGCMTSLISWSLATMLGAIQSVGSYFEKLEGAEE